MRKIVVPSPYPLEHELGLHPVIFGPSRGGLGHCGLAYIPAPPTPNFRIVAQTRSLDLALGIA
jgi:hypothetical protein